MMIHEITVKVGRHKKRRRIGRGIGSGRGKTCGRGHKGAGSRSGASSGIRLSHEGGQMPLFRRLPKRGFSNVQFRKRYSVVNIGALDARFDDGAEVNPDMLVKVGLIRDTRWPVKILGDGATKKKLTVMAGAFSRVAAEKITRAGGAMTTGLEECAPTISG